MILYLGLDPERWPHQPVYHYPIIRTERLPFDVKFLSEWPKFTHVIFTSRTAVQYWWEVAPCFDKKAIAIGPATAEALRKRGIDPLVAADSTQEGVIDLFKTVDLSQARIFCPRSKRARREIDRFFSQANIPFTGLALYDVVFQKPMPAPDLTQVEEIVFTSPSTVEAFIDQFGSLPGNKKLTPIGSVTREAIRRHLLKQDD